MAAAKLISCSSEGVLGFSAEGLWRLNIDFIVPHLPYPVLAYTVAMMPTSPDIDTYGPLHVATLRNGPVRQNAVLVWDDTTQEGYLIDPGDEAQRLLAWVRALGVQVKGIVLTHGHFDHIGAVEALRGELSAPVYLHASDLPLYRTGQQSAAYWNLPFVQPADPDLWLTQGQTLPLADSTLTVRELPGHAPGHVVLTGAGFAVVGDTLFAGNVGRTDLPYGDHEQLLRGIHQELLTLPDNTVIYPGHGKTTTIGRERAENPHL